MNEEIKDNIMRELYYKKSGNPIQIITILPMYDISDIQKAVDELCKVGYLILIHDCLKITEKGISFCLRSSFCCNSKPIVMQ